MPYRPDDLNALVKQVISAVEALDPRPEGRDVPAFAAQLRAARPELFDPLGGPERGDAAARAMAGAMLRVIGEIPQIVEAMLSAVDRRTTDPAVRCALVGALAYLVQPRDLMPDGLPGGFGFVDDCVILRATVTEFLDFLPRGFTTAERERRLLELLAVAIPPPRLPEFQAAVEEIWLAFHTMLWRTEEEIETLVARISADPLGTTLPAADRISIPLPPGPRLSLAPGTEAVTFDGARLELRFAKGGVVRVAANGEIESVE
jgi:uncharacterized membrane protein YkvA (DUF1232 family)